MKTYYTSNNNLKLVWGPFSQLLVFTHIRISDPSEVYKHSQGYFNNTLRNKHRSQSLFLCDQLYTDIWSNGLTCLKKTKQKKNDLTNAEPTELRIPKPRLKYNLSIPTSIFWKFTSGAASYSNFSKIVFSLFSFFNDRKQIISSWDKAIKCFNALFFFTTNRSLSSVTVWVMFKLYFLKI